MGASDTSEWHNLSSEGSSLGRRDWGAPCLRVVSYLRLIFVVEMKLRGYAADKCHGGVDAFAFSALSEIACLKI